MTVQEKLEVLEDILELDEGTLKVEDSLVILSLFNILHFCRIKEKQTTFLFSNAVFLSITLDHSTTKR